MTRRYLLVGTGPASIAAAEAIRTRQAEAEIVIVGAESAGYYSRPGLAYYLANEVPERRLSPFRPEDFARLRVRVLLARATRLDPVSHLVTLQTGEQLPYDRLLIATGARAMPLTVPGSDLDGVVKLDHLDDARDLVRRSRRAKAAVVVGGGITALEIVEGLHARGVKAHYFMRGGRYWKNVLSEAESRLVEEGLRKIGVQVHYNTELAQIVGRKGRVVAVETQTGDRIPCDLLGVAIGVVPQKDLAEEAGLRCARGVLVDQHLRTSHEHIFAAGDVAEVEERSTDRGTLEVLWSSAVAKGRAAGLAMSDDYTRPYSKAAPLNVTRLAGYTVTIMGAVGGGEDADVAGIVRGDSETWRHGGRATSMEWQEGKARIRLALRESTIAGAVVMGDQTLSFPLQQLVSSHVDVDPILDRLTQPSAAVGDLLMDLAAGREAHV